MTSAQFQPNLWLPRQPMNLVESTAAIPLDAAKAMDKATAIEPADGIAFHQQGDAGKMQAR
jgi:hypothetical protein